MTDQPQQSWGALHTPGLELGAWARFIRFQMRLWRVCARRLWENNVMAMSAALSFRTIFAMVPILVLGFVMLKSVGALEVSKTQLRQFLVASGFDRIMVMGEGVGEAGDGTESEVIDVASEIEDLVARVESKLTVGRIGPVGVILLLWSAMTLIGTMERSLNRIFGVRQSRSLRRRITFHWSAVTLGPLFLAAATYAGQMLDSLSSSENPLLSWVLGAIGWAGPVLVGVVFVATLYKLMPNAEISARSALGGALVSVPIWLIAKWAFAIYLEHFVSGGNVYGTLGLLPLFLVWLNFSWWIFLFGAQIVHAAAHLDQIQSSEMAENIDLGPIDLLAVAVLVAEHYASGAGPAQPATLYRQVMLPPESIDRLLDRLCDRGIICLANHEQGSGFLPTRPVDQVSLLEVVDLSGLPDSAQPQNRYDPEVASRLAAVQQQVGGAMGKMTLADVLVSGVVEQQARRAAAK